MGGGPIGTICRPWVVSFTSSTENMKGNGVGDEEAQVKTKPFLYRHVYGPVPSKRLGRSLGVDLAPFKRCTYDCIYCQLGRTTDKTVEPKAYATSEAICSELERKLSFGPPPDYISLAGSGEPTLNAGIGELIAKIKGMTNIPVAVLTNGSLLWRDEVRAALMAADLVLPSLDAGDEAMFQYVNRPHRDISFERMIAGLSDFVRVYPGPVWLEVFLLAGVTAMPGGDRENRCAPAQNPPQPGPVEYRDPSACRGICLCRFRRADGRLERDCFHKPSRLSADACRPDPPICRPGVRRTTSFPCSEDGPAPSMVFPPVWPCSPRRR